VTHRGDRSRNTKTKIHPDIVLRLVENPLRRRILQKLALEARYTLDLSKELGVSQQAICKHLRLLEEAGLVSSRIQKSSCGPPRLYYAPTRHYSISIAFGPSMFEASVEEYRNNEVRAVMKDFEKMLSEIPSLSEKMEALERIVEETEKELDMLRARLRELYLRKGLAERWARSLGKV
jgi:predicted transcriptional regulator